MFKTFIHKRPGFISVMALVTAVFIFIIGIGLLTLGFGRRLYSVRSNNQVAARCAADYGLTKAVYAMNIWLQGSHSSPLPYESSVTISGSEVDDCNVTYSYTVTNDGGTYKVQAWGTSGPITKTVLCDLRLKGLFEYAILTKNILDIGSCSYVTCVDCCSLPLRIGTTNNPTSQIILKPNSVVEGDILLGQNGTESLIVGSGATYGNVYAVATDFDLPEPSLPTNPDYATYATNINNLTKTSPPVETGTYICEWVDLKNGGTLDINGVVEIWVKNDIILKNSANIQLEPDSKLTIYLSGELDGMEGTGFNNGGEPSQLSIIGLSDNPITINNNGTFCGTIYAPHADVLMHNDTEVYGSIIANNYTQDNDAIFTYDAKLRTVSIEDQYARFVPIHWREL